MARKIAVMVRGTRLQACGESAAHDESRGTVPVPLMPQRSQIRILPPPLRASGQQPPCRCIGWTDTVRFACTWLLCRMGA
jgi:hypothetical protein